MDHSDHVDLLRPANLPPGGTVADLGAGSGAFTLALRELLGPGTNLYAVDRDRGRLAQLERSHRARYGNNDRLRLIQADIMSDTLRAELANPIGVDGVDARSEPGLDGILMANSLHFFREKVKVLRQVGSLLKSGGALLLVEYNVDRGNLWVPHPLSFDTFRELALQAGFDEPRLLAKRPSSFLREFYSALAYKHP